jgi:hypothetical protein
MPERTSKTAAELESMIMAELREYPECEAVGVVIVGPAGPDWDGGLKGEKRLNVECRVGLKSVRPRCCCAPKGLAQGIHRKGALGVGGR